MESQHTEYNDYWSIEQRHKLRRLGFEGAGPFDSQHNTQLHIFLKLKAFIFCFTCIYFTMEGGRCRGREILDTRWSYPKFDIVYIPTNWMALLGPRITETPSLPPEFHNPTLHEIDVTSHSILSALSVAFQARLPRPQTPTSSSSNLLTKHDFGRYPRHFNFIFL
jgi:hypothetical protein